MIKYIFGVLTLLLTLTNEASGQTCVSAFAAQAFNNAQCSQFLRVFNNVHTPCTAILWKTFTISKNNLCTQRFLSRFKGKPHILQIHFSNEAGRRNRRLSKYEHLPGISVNEYNRRLGRGHGRTVRAIQKNAKEIQEFILQYRNINSRILISTGLEDNYSTEAFKTILRTIKPIIKDVEFIRNPVGEHEKYYNGADFIELHGMQPHIRSIGQCIQNLDGISIKFSDGLPNTQEILLSAVPDYIKRGQALSCLTFLWWKEPQGITSIFTEPRKRKFLLEAVKINLTNNLIRRF